jgi:hypothetical protein
VAVQNLMAFPTKSGEVGLRVVTKCASRFQVVNIEVLAPSTYLTAPTVASKDLPAQLPIANLVQSKSRLSCE